MKKFFAAALLMLMPVFASAATFAQSPIFLSSNPATEGEKVRVYVVVSNDTDVSFSGTVSITADSTKLGSPAVTLAAGAAQTVSVNWTPTAGDHTIISQLVANDGTAGQQISQKFTVERLPEPVDTSAKPKTTDGVETSAQIQQSIGNVSPAAEKYSAPVFKVIDSGRVFAANQLTKAIDWSKQQINTSSSKKVTPFVTSSSTDTKEKGGASGAAGTAWNIFATVVLYVLSVLLYIVGHAGVFYPILAVVFFYILWRCWKRYRR
ncbi:MAG TPA: CARDB domain-containing protein [Candidatus Paceibacterota bacterium]|nr:CARDB domain-containing protein [Candidatus Paceibacterota bacterium]